MTRLWQFEALDTLFFREPRPFETIGGTLLGSYFPPPMRSLAGAVRTAIGQHHAPDIDWQRFKDAEAYRALRAAMGDADSYGKLRLRGPFLLRNGQRLFPAPLLLLKKEEEFVRLKPGDDVTHCDLGKVRLPRLERRLDGANGVENLWLNRQGLEEVLTGAVPTAANVYSKSMLWDEEQRLGIGRDNARRANTKGLLYQTAHVRPREAVALGVLTEGLEERWYPPRGAVRLGGEGRPAAFVTTPDERAAWQPAPQLGESQRFFFMLLTPALFRGDESGNFNQGMPSGFKRVSSQEPGVADRWEGEINGVPLSIVSAVLGRHVREGGWDAVKRTPRDLQTLVPAGSCYFCESQTSAAQVAAQLQGALIGEETELGRGEIAVGIW